MRNIPTRSSVGLLAAAITSCGSHVSSVGHGTSANPQQIITRSAAALRHIRQVTVTWSYSGYKGSASKGRLVVTLSESHAIGRTFPQGVPPPHITLNQLAQAVENVTDLTCPSLAVGNAHLTRRPDTTLHGVPVMRLTAGSDQALIANRNPPPLPQEVDLCGGGPFVNEAGDTKILFTNYRT